MNKENKPQQKYLGDGVYAKVIKSGNIVLTKGMHDPTDAINFIALKPEIQNSCIEYFEEVEAWRSRTDDFRCNLIGEPKTVGELREILSAYNDSTEFGFRNQEMQSLYELKNGKEKTVVFQ